MKKLLAMLLAAMFSLAACGQTETMPAKDEVSKEEYIQSIIDEMDAEEKAGQLIMADFRTNADGTGMTVLSEEAKDALRE